jgi:hypothetical protein
MMMNRAAVWILADRKVAEFLTVYSHSTQGFSLHPAGLLVATSL